MTDLADFAFSFASSMDDRSHTYHIRKRVIDLLGASLLLLVLLPVIAIIALAIKIDSRGSAIFKQHRVGARRVRSGETWEWRLQPFVFYKFRTMVQDAPPSLHKDYIAGYINGDEAEMAATSQGAKAADSYKLVHDPRVTGVGRILRKLSFDEIPQLWNVVKGEMSLVGPRPPIPYEVELYSEGHLRRLAATPGITGLWQVSGRSEIGFEDMVGLDIDYIRRRSIWLDVKILALTIPAVISRKGAG